MSGIVHKSIITNNRQVEHKKSLIRQAEMPVHKKKGGIIMAFLNGLFNKKRNDAQQTPSKPNPQETAQNMQQPTEVLLAVAEKFLNEGNEERAFQMYKSIAESSSDATAQYNLGSLYAQGKGTEQNLLEGAYWFRQVEKSGDEQAGKLVKKCELDYMRQNLTADTPKDLYERMKGFVGYVYSDEPADALIKRELTVLGMYHFNQKNYAAAAKLLRASAEFCNDGQAQNFLGVLYNAGAGVSKNDLVALYWLDRAVNNGYKDARKDREGILESYRASLTATEFQEYFERLSNWCETGTADIVAMPKRAQYWKGVSMSERRKLRVNFRIDKTNYTLEFEEKISIAAAFHSNAPLEECVYTVGSKRFKGNEPLSGEAIEVLTDGNGYYVSVKQDRYGDKIVYEHVTVPTFDSGDREWDSYRKYALIYDGKNIDVIAFKGGYKIANIDVYRKLKLGDVTFKQYFEKLNYPAGASASIKWVESDSL
ncbi:MAG: sel1 repeat family protein [Lachnospiraceae bacterium]|nr:sel1 repeat family protein [Lachnospiraceae bacterium]